MTSLDGGLAAVAIQDLATQHKRAGEDRLAKAIRENARLLLNLPDEMIDGPEINPIITALSRAGSSQSSQERAAQVLVKLRYEAMKSSDEMHAWNFAPRDAYEGLFPDAMAINKLFLLTQTERTKAHQLRTGLSYLKGVCRPLYTSWIEQVTSLEGMPSEDYFAEQQERLINYQIEHPGDLRMWFDNMYQWFERASIARSDSPSEEKTRTKFGLVSKNALRHYDRVWRDFTDKYSSAIWRLMQEYAELDSPSKRERDFKFHRPLKLGLDMKVFKNSNSQLSDSSVARPLTRQLASDSNNLASELIEEVTLLQKSSSKMLRAIDATASFDHALVTLDDTVERFEAANIVASAPTAKYANWLVTLYLKESSSKQLMLSKSWEDVDLASSEMAPWLDSRFALLLSERIDSAKIEVTHGSAPEELELHEADLDTVKSTFARYLKVIRETK